MYIELFYLPTYSTAVCVSVCGTHISGTVHLVGITLGMCIINGPGKCPVAVIGGGQCSNGQSVN